LDATDLIRDEKQDLEAVDVMVGIANVRPDGNRWTQTAPHAVDGHRVAS
jgi:hypothetical protein